MPASEFDDRPDLCLAVVWEDPPPVHRKGGGWRDRYAEVLAALRRHPGRWAFIATYKELPARFGPFPPTVELGFEFAKRWQLDGSCKVWGRYLGDDTLAISKVADPLKAQDLAGISSTLAGRGL